MCVSLLVALDAAPSFAQEAEEIPEPEWAEDPSIDEITVTGTASAITDVQDEAQAVTAFGMQDLDRANIANVEGLAFNVPSLHVGLQGSQVIVTLRGIGTQNASPTGEAGVALHVDGVNFLRPVAAQVAFFDLEGVKVERGPQGTRGGKQTTSGAIRVSTRKPSDEFELDMDAQVGRFNEQRYRGAFNIPISEYARFRAAGIWHERDGYIENILLNDDDKDPFDIEDSGFRTHFEILPTENLRSLFTYNYYQQGGVGPQVNPLGRDLQTFRCFDGRTLRSTLPIDLACTSYQNALGNELVPPRQLQVPGTPTFGKPQFTFPDVDSLGAVGRPEVVATDGPTSRDNVFWGFTSTTDWDLAPLGPLDQNRIRLIGSFQKLEIDDFLDFDGVSAPSLSLDRAEDSEQTSVEVQWHSLFRENVNLQLSGFYQQLKSENEFSLIRPASFQLLTNTLVSTPSIGEQEAHNRSYGLALHTEWLLSDVLTLQAGARYNKDVREITLIREQTDTSAGGGVFPLRSCEGGEANSTTQFNVLTPLVLGQNGLPLFPRVAKPVPTCEDTFRHMSGELKLEYRPWDEQLFYAGVSRGYKAGGFANLGFGQYEPEFNWAYHLGSKNSFFDDRLTMSSEIFFYDYKDLQIVQIDGLEIRTENAQAEIWGVDLETVLMPIDALELSAKVGYLDAEATEYLSIDPIDANRNLQLRNCQIFADSPCPPLTDYSGNTLPRSPEWSITLSASYTFYPANGTYGSLTPRVQYYWQDDTYYRIYNDPLDEQEAYHLTDIKLTWRSPTEAWTVETFVNNLEDDYVYQNLIIGPRLTGSTQNAWYGAPRTWGVRVGYRY